MFSGMPDTKYQNPGLSRPIRDCPGQSGTYGMYVPHCFLLYQRENGHFSKINFVVCKYFQFGHIQKLVVW